jgi:hypothetical protein
MATVRSAWGVFKARRIRGVDDRGDFYRFWYHSWELEQGENPLKGWWAMPVVDSAIATVFQAGGNLVLTDRRLLWEPITNGRAVYGRHGLKLLVNIVARAQDAVSPRTPLAWRLNEFTLDASESRQAPVWIVHSGGRLGFSFADGPILPGSRAERTDFMTLTRDVAMARR